MHRIKEKKAILILMVTAAILISAAGCGNGRTQGADKRGDPALEIAGMYGDIMSDGAKITPEKVGQIMDCLAEKGYAVADASGRGDFRNPQAVTDFFAKHDSGQEAELTIIEICADGGFIKTDISSGGGRRMAGQTRIVWNGSEPETTYKTQYELLELKYTDKGYIIFTQDIPDNTGTVHDGYIEPTTMIRVSAHDAQSDDYCKRYISILGYDSGRAFLTDWSGGSMGALVFNDVFPALYRAKYGEAPEYYNCTYETDAATGFALVPKDEFESIVLEYFDVTQQDVEASSVYNAEAAAYPIDINGVSGASVSVPEPEVVAYTDNGDGTLSLTVDALYAEHATDRAFTHTVTIRLREDGSLRYVSNRMQVSAGDILPEMSSAFSE